MSQEVLAYPWAAMPSPAPAFALTLSLFVLASLSAQAASPEQIEFFEKKIRPVLARECYECHSAALKQKGGLLLDSRPGWQAGGESGAAIIPGDAAKSLLMQSIRHEHDDLQMPKNGAKLSSSVIADFERWIADGAADPRDKAPTKEEIAKATDWTAVLADRKTWWALQPLANPEPPAGLAEHPVDAFILAKLKAAGLTQSPPADAASLARRRSYVLTGLPPASQPQSVEELLASPRYGEAWARHWMDWVRYAESYGSEGDPAIPYAWRYRDYLIRAFNADVPYPQLVREAIAGDLLPQPRLNAELGISESALGIGQLRMVNHGFSPTDTLDEMVTFTDNQIDVVSKAFQGLTVSCARCHNHKFDAISQTDFYAWFGVFSSTHPALIDAALPDSGKAEREQLTQLKQQLKTIVAKAWLAALPAASGKPQAAASAKPLDAASILARHDLSSIASSWFRDGKGLAQGLSKAGQFSIATEGDSIIAQLHGSGFHSDLISNKDRAVLMSPTFKCEGGTLWLRASGGGSARAKYVVQNYPRTGTIHKAIELKAPADAKPRWHKLDLDYWKGDTLFIQVSTGADLPAEAREDRSWFSFSEAIITRDASTPPPEPSAEANLDTRAAIEAWSRDTLSDAQARHLARLLETKKLPNDAKAIPEAAALLAKYRAVEARLPEPYRAPGVLEADARDALLFVQGDHKRPGQPVPRHFLDAIDPKPFKASNSGRLQLAEHLASPSNALAARVIVNRLWHHVFGRGLVSTTDNFGKLGSLPSHPELLDYLATRFVKSGGSVKAMLSLLLSSQTFQASSALPAGALEKDPDNALLSHWTTRRLPAEAIRDSLVALSGQLDLTMHGEPVDGKSPRRSVYVQVIRNRLDDFLTAFDAPVPMTTRGTRDSTNVPAQSLMLLNSPTLQKWTTQWARSTTEQTQARQRAARMFSQALGREASEAELTDCLSFVQTAEAETLRQQQRLDQLAKQATQQREAIAAILQPARDALAKQRGQPAAVIAPDAYAEWDFEAGLADLHGRLPLKLEGDAKLDNGALVLGGRGLARSAPLPKDFTAKTLEAWVQLDSLTQAGGGVVTVQDRRGVVFDSIVFAEKDARHWLAGSDNHKRTQSFEGTPDNEAATRPVHLAFVYKEGRVLAYRDGLPYGQPFTTTGTETFKAGDSEVLLGCRHGKPAGSRGLQGRLLRARLYDRALTQKEITASSQLEGQALREEDVLATLDASAQAKVKSLKAKLQELEQQTSQAQATLTDATQAPDGWSSLALSLVNLKEFIYLR